jgi:hypothetical protein
MTPLPDQIEQLLAAYLATPGVAAHPPSAGERALARQLLSRGVPLHIFRAAFLLAAVRRLHRRLPPIRSLHYFLPILDELLDSPPEPAYLRHLERSLAHAGDGSKIIDRT